MLIIHARSGQLLLLRDLFHVIEIPAPVEQECVGRGGERPGTPSLRQAIEDGWLRVARTPRLAARLRQKHPNLGRGEAAAIALAHAGGPESLLLMDDSLARNVARLLGVRVAGSLGILALAHERGMLKNKGSVEQALRRLLGEGGLWVSADVVEEWWAGRGGRG